MIAWSSGVQLLGEQSTYGQKKIHKWKWQWGCQVNAPRAEDSTEQVVGKKSVWEIGKLGVPMKAAKENALKITVIENRKWSK